MPDDLSDLWDRCREAIVARVGALPGLDELGGPPRVYKQKLPDVTAVELPAVLVTLEGCSEDVELFDTGNDETWLPVAVHLLDRQDQRDQSKQAAWTRWRLVLSTGFRPNAIQGDVPEAIRCDVRTMDALDARKSAGPAYQFATGSFWVRCYCVTPRIAY